MTNSPAAIAQGVDRPSPFDADRGWRLHPQVAVRPEPFGALLYHFGTRKLSFLKNRTVLELVQTLDSHPDVRSACRAVGIDDSAQQPYLHALSVLAESKMLVPQPKTSEDR
jgi:putative mycofactocin binding protein MftB